jgi:hypothetical protein
VSAEPALAGSVPAGLMVELPVLDRDDAREIEGRVRALRPRWASRGYRGSFTIGRAAYIDAAHGADAAAEYYEKLEAGNAVLREQFGGLLERVADRLGDQLGHEAELTDELALPGFHIFEGPGLPVGDKGVPHFDLQHRYLRWPSEPDPERLISFTLAIAIPREGAGLDTWDIGHTEAREAGKSVAELQKGKEVVRTRYRVGHLYLQPRMILHRIAGVPRLHDGDIRITLQGHGAYVDGRWVLYW